MDDKQQYWNVFAQTGRVEDYLRYREAVMAQRADKEEEAQGGTDSDGTDRPRTQYR